MWRQHGPDGDIVLVSFLGIALEDGYIGQQELAQRPQKALPDAIGIPVGDNPDHVSPFAQVLGAALFPAAALQFGREDFREVLANAVAY